MENEVIRYQPNPKIGLTEKQIENRIQHNLINHDTTIKTKTIPQIIRGNIFTLFNLLNVLLGLAIFLVGSYKNLLFLGVVFCNSIISILQEIQSKRVIDKLSLISATKVQVTRNSKTKSIGINEILLDDIVSFSIGNQVVVDSIIQEGFVEVNESLITGEGDAIHKEVGDILLSGSCIISGHCKARVEHIGMDNYTSKISMDAKYIKKVNSVMMNALKKVIKIVSILIIPVGIFLFVNQLQITNNTLTNAVVNTVAALIGMIPEGLVLLTSTVLAVSVIRLAKYNVLVQELYCIETLARVDTILLDKTGTLTEGTMELIEVISLSKQTNIEEILNLFTSGLENDNATMKAICQVYYKQPKQKIQKTIPFSSIRKYSAICTEKDSYILGSTENIIKEKNTKLEEQIEKYTTSYRVLLLAHSKDKVEIDKLPKEITPIALLLFRDTIRKEASRTLEYFKQQDVNIKIISGDHPITVSNIANRLGLSTESIDATTLKTEEQIKEAIRKYTIFGRTTPQQKKMIVCALKQEGHTVAMTGDGVNDVLALKEADCSIAMASGSDAARAVSQIVLLDSNFDSMPKIVAEGRRTINNIQRSATLFLCKTMYATLLALLFVFIEANYPFIPIQLSLTSMVTIGIPSFILALEPNNERIKGNFLMNILGKSFPSSITIVGNIILITILGPIFNFTQEQISTLAVILTVFTGFMLLYKISKPLNPIRFTLLFSMILLFNFCILVFDGWFSITNITFKMLLLIPLLMIEAMILFGFITDVFESISKKHPNWFE